ncbi:MAG: glutathione S-transferase family protein [Myxococcota bacterium]
MRLIIGNKNYSSWSFRAWLPLRVAGIPFEEDLRPFDLENDFASYREFSPTGRVPVLLDRGQTLWESIAILEYVAERNPDANLWPSDEDARSHGRCISHEVHSGFTALRNACPMNMRRRIESIPVTDAVRWDADRVVRIWTDCLARFGGPFLLGSAFTIADAMYAPMINRLRAYELSRAPAVLSYTETMAQLPAWKAWVAASKAEPWVVPVDEVYA